ncbi:hypothetical protein B0O99DRAFT_721284 [Bisporella sp. PMI_857]|nr:hypothetical protein B0O99DRAFT_721284 [Bisporella sp. PMI_857]
MRSQLETLFFFRQIITYLFLSNSFHVTARPAADTQSLSPNPTPVTKSATSNGIVITGVFTPTTLSISGLTPPITKATTITKTTTSGDKTETVAIAVAIGAGVVGAGALAAWLFKPIPGGPPAPTSPPPYSTSSQKEPSKSTSESPKTTTKQPTTTKHPTCPFRQVNPKKDFAKYTKDPAWTGPIPAPPASTSKPTCASQGSNKELLRGADPGYIKALAAVFCKSNLSKDQSKTLGVQDLPNDSTYKKSSELAGLRIKFEFKFHKKSDACPRNCVDSYSSAVKTCQRDSHTLYGGATKKQGCGTYSFQIDGDPITKLQCNKVDSRGQHFNYDYEDSAIQRTDDFCKSISGKKIKQGDKSTWIVAKNPETDFFSVEATSNCRGPADYKIDKDTCKKYFAQTINGCDTNTRTFKHGGILTDKINCIQFKFAPKSYDTPDCYPKNKDHGYITQGTHRAIKHDMAMDAIKQFCDRSGDGQQYTLDPSKTPSDNTFSQDTCKAKGQASCGYYYKNDGSRETKAGSLGDISIRMRASYFEPSGSKCQPKQKYEIHGERCRIALTKIVDNFCPGAKRDSQDLGSFVENGVYGCVRWDFWAVETH